MQNSTVNVVIVQIMYVCSYRAKQCKITGSAQNSVECTFIVQNSSDNATIFRKVPIVELQCRTVEIQSLVPATERRAV